jgi:hypothetical protein
MLMLKKYALNVRVTFFSFLGSCISVFLVTSVAK